MSNAIAKNKNSPLVISQEEERQLIHVLRDSLYPGAADESIRMVIAYCRAASLDVMKKPVHIVPMWDNKSKTTRDVVMAGIALYRIEASRTGEYIGKGEPEFGPLITMELGGVRVRFPEWCRMTVRRFVHGRECEFTAKEYWLENYATAKKDTDAPNAMWRKRAFGQLAKCTEAQALRMAFPEQTGGTNTDDEMEGKALGPIVDVTPENKKDDTMPRQIATDYRSFVSKRLQSCIDVNNVENEWNLWRGEVQKCADQGKPIPDDVQADVQDMIAAKRAEFAQAHSEAPVDEVPA